MAFLGNSLIDKVHVACRGGKVFGLRQDIHVAGTVERVRRWVVLDVKLGSCGRWTYHRRCKHLYSRWSRFLFLNLIILLLLLSHAFKVVPRLRPPTLPGPPTATPTFVFIVY